MIPSAMMQPVMKSEVSFSLKSTVLLTSWRRPLSPCELEPLLVLRVVASSSSRQEMAQVRLNTVTALSSSAPEAARN